MDAEGVFMCDGVSVERWSDLLRTFASVRLKKAGLQGKIKKLSGSSADVEMNDTLCKVLKMTNLGNFRLLKFNFMIIFANNRPFFILLSTFWWHRWSSWSGLACLRSGEIPPIVLDSMFVCSVLHSGSTLLELRPWYTQRNVGHICAPRFGNPKSSKIHWHKLQAMYWHKLWGLMNLNQRDGTAERPAERPTHCFRDLSRSGGWGWHQMILVTVSCFKMLSRKLWNTEN